jgi:phage-Barnase-EndoU-ColicinE5/D-RelE like nuclease3
MFEDLIPAAPAQTPPSLGLFDDLIPAGGAIGGAAGGLMAAPEGPDELALPRSTASTDPGAANIKPSDAGDQPVVPFSGAPRAASGTSPPGLFDDLIPAAAARGGAGGGAIGALAPLYEPTPDPSLGLKDAKTGIPLVRESTPGRFIAEVAGEDDGGLFWKDPQSGEIRRPSGNELIRPEGGKYKVYERDENVRPWTLADMALIRAIVSGFTAPRDALAGNMAPSEAVPRALDFAMFGLGGARTPTATLRPRGQAAAESADTLPADAGAGPLPDAQPRSLSAAAPDFGSGVLRIAGKALESARQSLRDLFEEAIREPPRENKIVDLGMITPEGAARLNGLLREAGNDLDVSGFSHTVDSYSARHSFTRHGDRAKAEMQGQVPLTSDDWAMIPTVLSSPDSIKLVGQTRHGLVSIGYWKRVDGLIYYIEEVRTGRATLSAVTMQKFKEGEAGVSGAPGGPDRLAPPRSTARTDPGPPNIDELGGHR